MFLYALYTAKFVNMIGSICQPTHSCTCINSPQPRKDTWSLDQGQLCQSLRRGSNGRMHCHTTQFQVVIIVHLYCPVFSTLTRCYEEITSP